VLFIGDDLLGPVDSRNPQGVFRPAQVSSATAAAVLPPAVTRPTSSLADEVAALFISLVDEISSNDAQPETVGAWPRHDDE